MAAAVVNHAPPQPIDPAAYFSREARCLQAASLSGLVGQFAGLPDVVALHAGLPPPATFPLSGLHLDAADGSHIDVTDKPGVVAAQQYEFGPGHPPLLEWIKQTMRVAHAPPTPVASTVTAGAVHGLSLAASLLCDPGDWMVMDEFTYSHAIEVVFGPKGVRPLPVRMDDQGMDPGHLREQLRWAAAQVAGGASSGAPSDDDLPPPTRPPRVAYLIPTGHNPTGITLSLARKRELYQVFREFGMLILEDDAYWWTAWGGGNEESKEPQGGMGGGGKSAAAAWYARLPRSFLSLDVDGRVVRVDTLSKVLSPGFRVGWVTAHPALVAKFALGAQATCVGSCPIAQVMVHRMLAAWGEAGWVGHLHRVSELYARKAAALEAAVATHLPGLARWAGAPGAGMFMWLQLLGKDGQRPPTQEALSSSLLESRVVVVPGSMSWADLPAAKRGDPCPFVRLTFAFLDEETLALGVQRLRAALQRAVGEVPL